MQCFTYAVKYSYISIFILCYNHQVTVMKRHEADAGQMIISRFEKNRAPVVVKLPGFASVAGQKVSVQKLQKNVQRKSGHCF